MKQVYLLGKKRSGKDTTADYIMDNYNAIKAQLAYPIKEALHHAFSVVQYHYSDIQKLTRDQIEGIDYDREQNLFLDKKRVVAIMLAAMAWLSEQKYLCATYNGLPMNSVERDVERVINNIEDDWSVRRLMQTLGTDIVVDCFDKMYWVKWCMDEYADNFEKYNYFIVPDVRQEHEISFARAMGATIVHVVRPDQEIKKDSHITERGLPVMPGDIVITNDGSLEELYKKIDKVLK